MTKISIAKVGTSTFDEESAKELKIKPGDHKTKGTYFVQVNSNGWLIWFGWKYPFVRKIRFDGVMELV
jgi:hypothetical protein